MDRIRKLKAERAKLLAKAKAYPETAAKEDNRHLTKEELAEVAELKSQINDLDEQIKALEELVELERNAPAQRTQIVNADGDDDSDGDGEGNKGKEGTTVTSVHDRSLDDPYRGFPKPEAGGLGMFLYSVIEASRQGRPDPLLINGKREDRLLKLTATAGSDEMHGESQKYGGFAVPVGFIARLMMLDMEDDPTRGVTTLPMQVPSVQIPARVDKNHSSSVSGGITVGWRPQTVEATASRMEMEQIQLIAQSMLGLSYVAEELLSDSAITVGSLLEAAFNDAVADAVIRARIEGTGVGEPLGILNSPALISVDTTSQTTGTIKGANLINMRSRAYKYSKCIWLANHDCLPALASAHISLSNDDVALFSPARGTDVPDTILGRPVVFTEYCKSISTVGDILLVNWAEYLVGTLQGVQMAESVHVRFTYNERAFRVSMRQAGAPWWRSTLTTANSSTTLSPYVGLATRTT